MNQDSDPRLGLPSASSFSIDALCPGRQQLLGELGDMPEVVDEDADRGTKLHKAWECHDTSTLDGDDMAIYERGREMVREVFEQWRKDLGGIENDQIVHGPPEERFYLHGEDGQVAASGQADIHFVVRPFALCIDYKALWARNLVPAERNWQARLLSVLLAREYGLIRVRFAFLKPMMNRSDIVDYTAQDLERAQYSIQQVLWESRQNGAQRRAGAHCRHCKAAAGCPEAQAWAMLPSVRAKAQNEGITPTVAGELVANISLLDCAKVFEGITSRRNIEDAIKARLKALSEPELAELGLMFGKAKTLRPITNPASAWSFLAMAGIPAEQLWRAVKIGNSELAAVVQESLKLSSKKAAEDWIRSKLANFITEQKTERPLEKI
jgi:hypothetical protein